jgi:thiamine-monophosphate kinase
MEGLLDVFGIHEKLSDLGEKRFLARLLPNLRPCPEFINGFGHDAGVIDLGLKENICMTIDRSAKPLSYSMGISEIEVWARLCCTANFSDLLAVGGCPRAFMLSVMCSAGTPAELVARLIFEVERECARHGVAFLGGDTKEASEFNLVGCAIGTIERGISIPRTPARIGDALFCAGNVGGFTAAVLAHENNSQCALSTYEMDALKSKLDYPDARWTESQYARKWLSPTAAMDNSDGLFDVYLQMTGGKSGILIEHEKIPYDRSVLIVAERLGIDPLNFLFSIGDWSIIYAADLAKLSTFDLREMTANGVNLIGRFIEEKGLFIERADGRFEVQSDFNNHFTNRIEAARSLDLSIRESVRLRRVIV